jgi:hypothetical protein
MDFRHGLFRFPNSNTVLLLLPVFNQARRLGFDPLLKVDQRVACLRKNAVASFGLTKIGKEREGWEK